MAWTTPATWAVDQLVTATDLNTHLRDNLNALKTPPSAHYEANQGSDYTTTSTSFVDVDSTNFALTITTAGGDVFLGFHGSVESSGPSGICFDVLVDGVAQVGGNDGIVRVRPDSGSDGHCPSFARLVSGLAAGQHTFKLQWKTFSGTATLFAGAGTSAKDVHPQFWAREMS
jgi:hypothetical protein